MSLVTSTFENNELRLALHDRVETANAAEAEAEITALCEKHPTDCVVVDADDLVYISSAGLRVILRLRKMKPQLRIVNASAEIFDILEMTGFTEMIPTEKAYRKLSVDGCEVIGRGAKGIVYRYNDDTIIKVYKNTDCLPEIQNERELSRKAFVLGIPTAIPYDIIKVGDKFGSVFELLNANSYSQLLQKYPERSADYAADFAKLLRQIHATAVKESDMPDGKQMLYKWASTAANYLSESESAALTRLIDELNSPLSMLHCDFHTNNILMQNGETLLIDMDTISHGHPIIDLANIHAAYCGFNLIDPDNSMDFLGISVEAAEQFYFQAFCVYFAGLDEAQLAEKDKKIRLLSTLRVLHFMTRHGKTDAIVARAEAVCPGLIRALLGEVTTLND